MIATSNVLVFCEESGEKVQVERLLLSFGKEHTGEERWQLRKVQATPPG
jgi:hypothetical protein